MTNAELIQKIRNEIISRIDKRHLSEQAKNELVSIISFLSTLESEKPMNQDELEKAVIDYFEGYWPGMETPEQCNTHLQFTPPAIMRLARHFAQWQKEQMLKEAVEGEYDSYPAAVYLDAPVPGIEHGEKVRVIVLK